MHIPYLPLHMMTHLSLIPAHSDVPSTIDEKTNLFLMYFHLYYLSIRFKVRLNADLTYAERLSQISIATWPPP